MGYPELFVRQATPRYEGRGLADVLGVRPEVSTRALAPSRTRAERRAAAERYRDRRRRSARALSAWVAVGLLVFACLAAASVG